MQTHTATRQLSANIVPVPIIFSLLKRAASHCAKYFFLNSESMIKRCGYAAVSPSTSYKEGTSVFVFLLKIIMITTLRLDNYLF